MNRILITGASRGIGRATANKLADKGRTLFLQGRDEAALKRVAEEVERRGASATVLAADLSDTRAIERMVDSVGEESVDVLINNAGLAIVKPVDQITIEEWQESLAVNVTAPFLLSQRLLSNMSEGAAIVNLLSIAASNGFPTWSSYCATKFALDGFSRALREELRSRGIRVITVSPSATNTELWDSVSGDFARERMLDPGEVAEAIAFALSRPSSVLVDTINVGNIAGTL
ncbi:SDR family NAD(P)-dependent oxidoreductase [candidate division GN15 bacterium]|nr:SDR family NAD(P)-dependent oxidoreductase [candidate division GN15 bacterium]